MEQCGECKFYVAGDCRINPPQVVSGQGGSRSTVWPNVNRDGWCGQFTYPEQAHHFKLGSPQITEKSNG